MRHSPSTMNCIGVLWIPAIWVLAAASWCTAQEPGPSEAGKDKAGTYHAHYMPGGITVDGVLDEWSDATVYSLDRADHLFSLTSVPWGKAVGATRQEQLRDLSVRFRMAYDAETLYLAFAVHDDTFSQHNTGVSLFQGDSIQIAFDTLGEGTVNAYDANDYEWSLAETKAGAEVVLGYGEKNDKHPVKLAVVHDKDNTVHTYEVAYPLASLAPLTPAMGQVRFSFLVNDNDGSGRRQWMQLTGGIGDKKDPSQFALLRFTGPKGEGAIADVPDICGSQLVVPETVVPESLDSGELELRFFFTSPKDMPRVTLSTTWTDREGHAALEKASTVDIKAGANPLATRVDMKDLAAGRYDVAVRLTDNGTTVAENSARVQVITREEIRSVHARAEQLLATLDRTLSELDPAYAADEYMRCDLRLARDFLAYIDNQLAKKAHYDADKNIHVPVKGELLAHVFRRAYDNAQYVCHAIEEAGRRLEMMRRGELNPRPAPALDLDHIAIRDGSFYAGDRPVILFGSLCWEELANDMPILRDYGFTLVEQECSPRGGYDENGSLRADVLKRVAEKFDRAHEQGVVIDFLFGVHVFPSWAYEKYPQIAHKGDKCASWMPRIEHAQTRELYGAWLRAMVDLMADKPALHSYILANEPSYYCECPETIESFRQSLREKYQTIESVN
ncbi:MAG: hypothetical protein GXY83_04495, partial [Rhodopirellula sp.]|nr:hypothetical protein [Rhodopirellula sp.]